MKRALWLACALFFAFTGCKKDDDEESQKERSELLIGTWQITGFSSSPGIDYDEDGDVETDLYGFIPACTQDDLTKFLTGGITQTDEGATKCSPTDEQTYEGTWALEDNDNTLVLDGDPYNIAQLDNSILKVTFSDEDDDGVSYLFTFTLHRR